MESPRTAQEAIGRFRLLPARKIAYQLNDCPIWKPGALPAVGAKGNCSIAATWALGLSILQPLDTWLNSSGIFKDAVTPGGLFTKIERAIPGCLAVFTKRKADAAGHVGMVTQVDLRGRASRVIDCSPRNGREDSVREHGAEVFLARSDTIYVWYTGISSDATPEPIAKPVAPPPGATHTPPAETVKRLGNIAAMVRVAPRIIYDLAGLDWMCHLPGALYFESDLDLDTDGEEELGIKYESTHQRGLSIGAGVNSNRVPYIVLPVGFARQHGLRLGDVAAVLYKDRIEFAVYADNGPRMKIGEGSISLHRSLGFERVKNGKIVDVGVGSGVVTVIFAGSGNGTAQTPERIRAIGKKHFEALGGVLT